MCFCVFCFSSCCSCRTICGNMWYSSLPSFLWAKSHHLHQTTWCKLSLAYSVYSKMCLNAHKTGFPTYFVHIILLTSFFFKHHLPINSTTILVAYHHFHPHVFATETLPRLRQQVAVGQAGDFQRSTQRQGAHDGQQDLIGHAHVAPSLDQNMISDGY